MNVTEAIEQRRAVKHFDPAFKIPEAEMNKMLDLVLQSPTSFNIQNWRFVHVKDSEKRLAIQEAAWNQEQITKASDLFIFCADLKAWEKDPARYWRSAPKEVADYLVSMIGPFYQGREWMQRDEAMRSVGIAAQSLMLISKEYGYDSCPMIGFDQDKVAEIINLPEDHVIGMIVVVGKKTSEPHARGGSIEKEEAIITNQF